MRTVKDRGWRNVAASDLLSQGASGQNALKPCLTSELLVIRGWM